MKIDKVVIDFNIFMNLIFKKNGWSRKIFEYFVSNDVNLYTPFYINIEFNKYLEKIKNKISREYFEEIILYFFDFVNVIPSVYYEDVIDELKLEIEEVDPKDIDYVALAYKLRCPLWTNDKKLKKLKCIEVFSTEELMQKFENF